MPLSFILLSSLNLLQETEQSNKIWCQEIHIENILEVQELLVMVEYTV
jgi:hypothetical protein